MKYHLNTHQKVTNFFSNGAYPLFPLSPSNVSFISTYCSPTIYIALCQQELLVLFMISIMLACLTYVGLTFLLSNEKKKTLM